MPALVGVEFAAVVVVVHEHRHGVLAVLAMNDFHGCSYAPKYSLSMSSSSGVNLPIALIACS